MTGEAPRIGVIDYGMGNRRSVEKALERAGALARISRDRDELRRCHGLVLPGVGAFPLAMHNLHELGLDAFLDDRVKAGVPLLGICLGMQLLFERSEELEPTTGLGLLSGRVTRLNVEDLRIPHIGWNEVIWERPSVLAEGLPGRSVPFYHVHSFAVRPDASEDVAATSEYGERFATVVQRGQVFGVQFHPEKSSRHGLELLANFVGQCAPAKPVGPRVPSAAVPARG